MTFGWTRFFAHADTRGPQPRSLLARRRISGPGTGRLAAPIKDLPVALAIAGGSFFCEQKRPSLADISTACRGHVPDAARSTAMGHWTKICRLCHGTYS